MGSEIGVRIKATADVSEVASKFGSLSNSIASSGKAFNSSLKTGDINASKDYADLQLGLRNQYLKDAKIGGYSEIKLDSKPLETGIRSLEAVINQMITEGRSKEAKEYGGILKDLQHQYNLENEDDSDKKTKIAQDQQTRFIRGMSRFMGQGSNFIGQAGGGNVAGAALGAAGGATDLIGMVKGLPAPVLAGAGIAAAVIGLGAAANKLSEQWEKMMQPSMGLAASLGELGSDAKRNSAVFKEVFNRATDARVLHGYKLEEGLQLANDLSKTGVKTENIYKAESQVFGYQRATDADRGSLTRAVGLSERYRGGENVLGYAYGGLQASGMQQGQYQEYLNATLRIFEEGLSKGVVKGFAEITRTQNMLATIGETWKGEAGLERRQGIDSAISGAYNLEGDHDVIMYRAAQTVAGPEASYGDIAKLLDKGIDGPEGDKLLRAIGDTIKQVAGDGEAGVMQTMKMFSLNYTAAEEFFDAISGRNPDFGKARDVLKDPESKDVETTESKLLTVTEQIRQDITNFGSNFTEAKLGVISGLSKITNLIGGERAFASSSVKTMDVMTEIGVTGERARKAETAFEKAYTAKGQPDSDDNGLGDYGENAKKIQEAMAALPEGMRYFLAANPNNLIYSMLDKFKGAGDFNEENTRMALSQIQLVSRVVGGQSEDELKKQYLDSVASSVKDDPRSREDDKLRYLLREHGDVLPPEIIEALETARGKGTIEGTDISTQNFRGFSEVGNILKMLESIASKFEGLPEALREANTINFQLRDE